MFFSFKDFKCIETDMFTRNLNSLLYNIKAIVNILTVLRNIACLFSRKFRYKVPVICLKYSTQNTALKLSPCS
ncbi:hypothetical protein NBO_19g0004 [Nosema bombycis CQ1]|uniref:Uncharacterized protein n=1 Tax=Nosema bombycis (strain CQ1 / CVCC 102059) TaxID=578461 RepID=R0KUU8_NOSB1|nr:hypothetical protein NBO_19g0004 [Nosema bombycis CQ1]|eukprot:EOB14651.1 hypothetical protein NBO_19g0004 [Nosema bombycis CQ1]